VGKMMRNARGRLRVGKLDVRTTIGASVDRPERIKRCLELFEDYCVVTAGVRQGIPGALLSVSLPVPSPRQSRSPLTAARPSASSREGISFRLRT
jgi:hypothetical protein